MEQFAEDLHAIGFARTTGTTDKQITFRQEQASLTTMHQICEEGYSKFYLILVLTHDKKVKYFLDQFGGYPFVNDVINWDIPLFAHHHIFLCGDRTNSLVPICHPLFCHCFQLFS